MSREQSAGVVGREQAQPSSFNEAMDIEDHIVDNVQSPLLSPVDKESPFTYLAVLSAKQAAIRDGASKVEGKIKVILPFSFYVFIIAYGYLDLKYHLLPCYLPLCSLILFKHPHILDPFSWMWYYIPIEPYLEYFMDHCDILE